MKRKLLFVVLLLVPATMWPQVTPDFAKNRDETVKNLQTPVRIDTSNPPGNETRAAEYIKSVFDKDGINTEIIALASKRAKIVTPIKGNGKKRATLQMGHKDALGYERQSWT